MSCRRFEEEGLDLLESGEPLGEHFSVCPECRARRAAYEALWADLAALGEDEEPPAGWRERVRREIRGRRGARRETPRIGKWWWAAAAALAAAVLVPRWQGPQEPTLRVSFERGSVAFRGGDETPKPGDTLHLAATGRRRQRLELRLYRNGKLLARCETSPGSDPRAFGPASCVRRRGGLSLRTTLDAVARYRPLLLLSTEPLPPPAGDLDADVGAALRAGARVEMGDEIVVR